METLLITYRVRPERLDEHLLLFAAVSEELARTRPTGLRYLSLRLDDGLSFVDVVMGPELPEPLPSLESFRRFRSGLEERCEQRDTTGFTVLGSYGMG
ncbi:hypothetical protein SAMN05443287_101783 [Micromonospora phaseoli]|uniref:Antibiotic biosynthesis monooxygenase n=1 Tax=Micromonospora phaseoli TaxID=1144548 RepID=A0A1H6SN32_9ACTN|nr:hypothetical protein [Micromonospora phaseoli]PZW04031.1 hypothetical protein CLV64_101783 [Micromonospora phaseoli]SEI69273.1 hypothetical protein SAMN05443287_101783 [Micromonospora phaseoli]